MHALEVIVKRNLEAQGRALAHADNDGDRERATNILTAAPSVIAPEWDAFVEGYERAIEEG